MIWKIVKLGDHFIHRRHRRRECADGTAQHCCVLHYSITVSQYHRTIEKKFIFPIGDDEMKEEKKKNGNLPNSEPEPEPEPEPEQNRTRTDDGAKVAKRSAKSSRIISSP